MAEGEQIVRVSQGVVAEEGSCPLEFQLPDRDDLELLRRVMAEHFDFLLGFRILLYFLPEAGTSQGRVVLGKAIRATKRERAFFGVDGWIELAMDKWEEMSEQQQERLVYHELMHFSVKEGSLSMRTHDVQLFQAEVALYGELIPEVREMQQSLPLQEEVTPELRMADEDEDEEPVEDSLL